MSLPQAVALYNISQNCPQNTKVKVKILELPNPIHIYQAQAWAYDTSKLAQNIQQIKMNFITIFIITWKTLKNLQCFTWCRRHVYMHTITAHIKLETKLYWVSTNWIKNFSRMHLNRLIMQRGYFICDWSAFKI